MKIAFLHHSFMIGSGIDSLIYQYAKRLAPAHQVEVFTFRSHYELSAEPWGIKVIDIPFGKTRLGSGVFAPLFLPWRRLRKELEQFDVVIAQLYPTNLIPVLPSKLDTNVIMIEWSTPDNVWDRWQEHLYTKLAKQASKIACRRADKVLVSSRFVQRYVEENYGVSSRFILLDGIDFDLFDKSRYKSRAGNNILYVGRISPHKNLHTLIMAFKQVRDKVPSATLTLVGAHTFPSYSYQLKRLVSELGLNTSVRWPGAVLWEELPRFYADCSVCCSPSLWEGFMRCEAFALEKPMVVFDTTANTETVHDGTDGVVVRWGVSQGLAPAMVYLLKDEDKRKAMGEAGYRWAKENLDLNIITANLLKEISE